MVSGRIVIDDTLIRYLEDLSFISLSADERKRIASDLENILRGMELLSQLDTGEVQVPSLDHTAALRKDEVRASLPREDVIKNAAQTNGETFVVPQTVE